MRKTLLTTGFLLAGILASAAFAEDIPCASELIAPREREAATEPRLYLVGQDITKLHALARSRNLLLSVIVPNPNSLKYAFQPGFVAKTADLKGCKSAREGENAGLVQCSPNQYSTYQEWMDQKADLRAMGYTVMGPKEDYLVVRFDGKKIFSDYDLLGVYDLKTARAAFSEDLRNTINTSLGRRMVRHGPLLDYEHRQMIGLKFPVITFTPDIVEVSHNLEQLIALYRRYGLNWDW